MKSHEQELELQQSLTRATRARRLRMLNSPALRLSARYDAEAPRWHRRMRAFGYPRAYARLFARLRDAGWLHSPDAGGRVLDCGIGTGALSLALARVVPVREVVGVDISPGMLREAAAQFAAAGVHAHTSCADAQRLTLPDASFDMCVSAHMLEHLAQPREAIFEMARVVRRGAPLVIIATRDSCADRLVRLKWGHVFIPRTALIAWMRSAGLANIVDCSLGGPLSPARWLSRAIVGCKS